LLTAAALPISLAISGPGSHGLVAWRVGLTILAWLPLIVRTRWPLPVAAVAVVIDTVHIAVAAHGHPAMGVTPLASMLALYTVGALRSARVAWSSALAASALQCLVAALTFRHHLGSDLLYANWALGATLVGRFVRERQQRIETAEQRVEAAERTKDAEARRQVLDERLRIARELHDVLAHHITVVNAQAGVAQYLLRADPDAAEKALTGITENTRAALDDLRATLGLLRSDHDAPTVADSRSPTPSLSGLPALVDSFTAGGVAITVHSSGSPRPLSGPVELAAYRITQEALTNAAKHAPGSSVELNLQWGDDFVLVEVINGPPTQSSPRPAIEATGQGLIGMRERAAAAGGVITVGAAASGGYRVAATLPLTTDGSDGSDSAEVATSNLPTVAGAETS
jgi:signal transduction histidine kinase